MVRVGASSHWPHTESDTHVIALDSMLRVLRQGARFTVLSHSSPVIAARIFDAEKRFLTKSNVASVTAV